MSATSPRNWIKPVLKLAVLVAVVWGGHRTIESGLIELQKDGRTLDQIEPGWLALSGALYLISQVPTGLFWHRVLIGMGQQVSRPRALRAYLIGHLGKYVPGKAMVLVIRTGLIRGNGVQTAPAIAAIFYETLSTMAIGALLATIFTTLALSGATMEYLTGSWQIVLISLGLTLALGLPTLPVVFNLLLTVLKKDRHSNKQRGNIQIAEVESSVDNKIPAARLTLAGLMPGWPGLIVGWLLMGVSLWAAIRGLGTTDIPGPIEGLPLYTTAVALAVVAGFISLLPGGVGVREVALLSLLEPTVGAANAVGGAVLLRLTWLAAEVALSAILYFSGERLQWRKRGDTATD